jgi:hypothetical protein
MKPSTLDTLIWVFLYGGLLIVGLGLSVSRSDASLGWALVTGGGVITVLGAVLVYVRSRMNEK